MVNTPRTRHSSTTREPTTIDLGPDEVSRLSPEGEVSQDEAAEAVKEDIGASETAGQPHEETRDTVPEAGTPAGEAPSEPREDFYAEAKPVEQEAVASEAAQEPPPFRQSETPVAPPPARSRGGAAIVAGLAGGLIALVGGGLLQFAGVLGTPGPSGGTTVPAPVQTDIAALKTEITGLKAASGNAGEVSGRIDGLSQALDQVKADVASLRQAVDSGSAGGTAGIDALNTKIAEIETRINAIGPGPDGATPEDIAAINEKIAGVEVQAKAASEAGSSINNRLGTLEQNLGALEQNLAALSTKVESQSQQPKVALAIAASALKAAIERGSPFEPELETLAAIAPQAPGLTELRAFADKGIATREEIVAEIDAAAKAMIAAANPPSEDADFFERLLSSAESMVTVRPIGAVEGPGVPETVARMEVALEAGDLAKAIAEFDTLPEPAKAAGAAFADKIRARLTAEQLADQAVASAMQAP